MSCLCFLYALRHLQLVASSYVLRWLYLYTAFSKKAYSIFKRLLIHLRHIWEAHQNTPGSTCESQYMRIHRFPFVIRICVFISNFEIHHNSIWDLIKLYHIPKKKNFKVLNIHSNQSLEACLIWLQLVVVRSKISSVWKRRSFSARCVLNATEAGRGLGLFFYVSLR